MVIHSAFYIAKRIGSYIGFTALGLLAFTAVSLTLLTLAISLMLTLHYFGAYLLAIGVVGIAGLFLYKGGHVVWQLLQR